MATLEEKQQQLAKFTKIKKADIDRFGVDISTQPIEKRRELRDKDSLKNIKQNTSIAKDIFKQKLPKDFVSDPKNQQAIEDYSSNFQKEFSTSLYEQYKKENAQNKFKDFNNFYERNILEYADSENIKSDAINNLRADIQKRDAYNLKIYESLNNSNHGFLYNALKTQTDSIQSWVDFGQSIKTEDNMVSTDGGDGDIHLFNDKKQEGGIGAAAYNHFIKNLAIIDVALPVAGAIVGSAEPGAGTAAGGVIGVEGSVALKGLIKGAKAGAKQAGKTGLSYETKVIKAAAKELDNGADLSTVLGKLKNNGAILPQAIPFIEKEFAKQQSVKEGAKKGAKLFAQFAGEVVSGGYVFRGGKAARGINAANIGMTIAPVAAQDLGGPISYASEVIFTPGTTYMKHGANVNDKKYEEAYNKIKEDMFPGLDLTKLSPQKRNEILALMQDRFEGLSLYEMRGGNPKERSFNHALYTVGEALANMGGFVTSNAIAGYTARKAYSKIPSLTLTSRTNEKLDKLRQAISTESVPEKKKLLIAEYDQVLKNSPQVLGNSIISRVQAVERFDKLYASLIDVLDNARQNSLEVDPQLRVNLKEAHDKLKDKTLLDSEREDVIKDIESISEKIYSDPILKNNFYLSQSKLIKQEMKSIADSFLEGETTNSIISKISKFVSRDSRTEVRKDLGTNSANLLFNNDIYTLDKIFGAKNYEGKNTGIFSQIDSVFNKLNRDANYALVKSRIFSKSSKLDINKSKFFKDIKTVLTERVLKDAGIDSLYARKTIGDIIDNNQHKITKDITKAYVALKDIDSSIGDSVSKILLKSADLKKEGITEDNISSIFNKMVNNGDIINQDIKNSYNKEYGKYNKKLEILTTEIGDLQKEKASIALEKKRIEELEKLSKLKESPLTEREIYTEKAKKSPEEPEIQYISEKSKGVISGSLRLVDNAFETIKAVTKSKEFYKGISNVFSTNEVLNGIKKKDATKENLDNEISETFRSEEEKNNPISGFGSYIFNQKRANDIIKLPNTASEKIEIDDSNGLNTFIINKKLNNITNGKVVSSIIESLSNLSKTSYDTKQVRDAINGYLDRSKEADQYMTDIVTKKQYKGKDLTDEQIEFITDKYLDSKELSNEKVKQLEIELGDLKKQYLQDKANTESFKEEGGFLQNVANISGLTDREKKDLFIRSVSEMYGLDAEKVEKVFNFKKGFFNRQKGMKDKPVSYLSWDPIKEKYIESTDASFEKKPFKERTSILERSLKKDGYTTSYLRVSNNGVEHTPSEVVSRYTNDKNIPNIKPEKFYKELSNLSEGQILTALGLLSKLGKGIVTGESTNTAVRTSILNMLARGRKLTRDVFTRDKTGRNVPEKKHTNIFDNDKRGILQEVIQLSIDDPSILASESLGGILKYVKEDYKKIEEGLPEGTKILGPANEDISRLMTYSGKTSHPFKKALSGKDKLSIASKIMKRFKNLHKTDSRIDASLWEKMTGKKDISVVQIPTSTYKVEGMGDIESVDGMSYMRKGIFDTVTEMFGIDPKYDDTIKFSQASNDLSGVNKGLTFLLNDMHLEVDPIKYKKFKEQAKKTDPFKMIGDYPQSYFNKYYSEKFPKVDILSTSSTVKTISGKGMPKGKINKVDPSTFSIKYSSAKDEKATLSEHGAHTSIDYFLDGATGMLQDFYDYRQKASNKIRKAGKLLGTNFEAPNAILKRELGKQIVESTMQGRGAEDMLLGGNRTSSAMKQVSNIMKNFFDENVLRIKELGGYRNVQGVSNTDATNAIIAKANKDFKTKEFSNNNTVFIDREKFSDKIWTDSNGVERMTLMRYPTTKFGSIVAPRVLDLKGAGKSVVVPPALMRILLEADADGDKLMIFNNKTPEGKQHPFTGSSAKKYFENFDKTYLQDPKKLKTLVADLSVLPENEKKSRINQLLGWKEKFNRDNIREDSSNFNENKEDWNISQTILNIYGKNNQYGRKKNFDDIVNGISKAKDLIDKKYKNNKSLEKTPIEKFISEIDLQDTKIAFNSFGLDGKVFKNVINELNLESFDTSKEAVKNKSGEIDEDKIRAQSEKLVDNPSIQNALSTYIIQYLKKNELNSKVKANEKLLKKEIKNLQSKIDSDPKNSSKERELIKTKKQKLEDDTTQSFIDFNNIKSEAVAALREVKDLIEIHKSGDGKVLSEILLSTPWVGLADKAEKEFTTKGIDQFTEFVDKDTLFNYNKKFNEEYSSSFINEIFSIDKDGLANIREQIKNGKDPKEVIRNIRKEVNNQSRYNLNEVFDNINKFVYINDQGKSFISNLLKIASKGQDTIHKKELDNLVDEFVTFKSYSKKELKQIMLNEEDFPIIKQYLKENADDVVDGTEDSDVIKKRKETTKNAEKKNAESFKVKTESIADNTEEISALRQQQSIIETLLNKITGGEKDPKILEREAKEKLADRIVSSTQSFIKNSKNKINDPKYISEIKKSMSSEVAASIAQRSDNSFLYNLMQTTSQVQKVGALNFRILGPLIEALQTIPVRLSHAISNRDINTDDKKIKMVSKVHGIKNANLPKIKNIGMQNLLGDINNIMTENLPNSMKGDAPKIWNKALHIFNKAISFPTKAWYTIGDVTGVFKPEEIVHKLANQIFEREIYSEETFTPKDIQNPTLTELAIMRSDKKLLFKDSSKLSGKERALKSKMIEDLSRKSYEKASEIMFSYARNPLLIKDLEIASPFINFNYSFVRNLFNHRKTFGALTAALMTVEDEYGEEAYYYDYDTGRNISTGEKMLRIAPYNVLMDLTRMSGAGAGDIGIMKNGLLTAGKKEYDWDLDAVADGRISGSDYLIRKGLGNFTDTAFRMVKNKLQLEGKDEADLSKDKYKMYTYMFGISGKSTVIKDGMDSIFDGEYDKFSQFSSDVQDDVIKRLNKNREKRGQAPYSKSNLNALAAKKEYGLSKYETSSDYLLNKTITAERLLGNIDKNSEKEKAEFKMKEYIFGRIAKYGDFNEFLDKVIAFTNDKRFEGLKKIDPKSYELYKNMSENRIWWEYYAGGKGFKKQITPDYPDKKNGGVRNNDMSLKYMALKFKVKGEDSYKTLDQKAEALYKNETSFALDENNDPEFTDQFQTVLNNKGFYVAQFEADTKKMSNLRVSYQINNMHYFRLKDTNKKLAKVFYDKSQKNKEDYNNLLHHFAETNVPMYNLYITKYKGEIKTDNNNSSLDINSVLEGQKKATNKIKTLKERAFESNQKWGKSRGWFD